MARSQLLPEGRPTPEQVAGPSKTSQLLASAWGRPTPARLQARVRLWATATSSLVAPAAAPQQCPSCLRDGPCHCVLGVGALSISQPRPCVP